METKLPNGGFPPIKICSSKNSAQTNSISKERLIAPTITKNINIRTILNSNIKKPIITNDDEELNVIEELNIMDEI